MEALKAIGLIIGVVLGFGILVGIGAVVSAIGFFLGWALLGLFIIGAIIFGILDWIKNR